MHNDDLSAPVAATELYSFQQYAAIARRTIRDDPPNMRLFNGAMGLAGEAGEVIDHIKKHFFHGADLDIARVADEIGDVLWYLNEIALTLGVSLDICARMNNIKLIERHNGGAFSEITQRAQSETTPVEMRLSMATVAFFETLKGDRNGKS